MGTAEAAIREVEEFHAFLVRWLNGSCPRGGTLVEEQLARFDPDFLAISPGGRLQTREALREWLAGAWGTQPRLSIRISNAKLRRRGASSILLTYEEHQTAGPESNSRLSTVLFVVPHDDPSSVHWFHLHEVWLPTEAEGQSGGRGSAPVNTTRSEP